MLNPEKADGLPGLFPSCAAKVIQEALRRMMHGLQGLSFLPISLCQSTTAVSLQQGKMLKIPMSQKSLLLPAQVQVLAGVWYSPDRSSARCAIKGKGRHWCCRSGTAAECRGFEWGCVWQYTRFLIFQSPDY